jgi:NAD+ kinase
MIIDIIANDDKPEALKYAAKLHKFLKVNHDVLISPKVSPDTYADLVLTVGGDGTILRTIGGMGDNQRPVLGINLGNVGFLADLDKNDNDKISDIRNKTDANFNIEERMRIDVVMSHGFRVGTALNEVNISSSRPSRMITFSISIDEIVVHTFRADGIIISAPTGSTAYSLGGGGPIVDPFIESYLITPIMPCLLSSRPMMISTKRELSIGAMSSEPSVLLIDGEVAASLTTNDYIKIKKSPIPAKFVDVGRNFFIKVDEKLRR